MALYDYITNIPITDILWKLNGALNSIDIQTPITILNDLTPDGNNITKNKKNITDNYFWELNYDYIKSLVPTINNIYDPCNYVIIADKCKEILAQIRPAYDTLKNIIDNTDDLMASFIFIKSQIILPEKYKMRTTKREGKYNKLKDEDRDIFQIITMSDLIKILQNQNDSDAHYVLDKIAGFIILLQTIPDAELHLIMGKIIAQQK